MSELDDLRKRVKAQRAELRRLNKVLGPYWHGFKRGIQYEETVNLRRKMFAAFGIEAVQKAERVPLRGIGDERA